MLGHGTWAWADPERAMLGETRGPHRPQGVRFHFRDPAGRVHGDRPRARGCQGPKRGTKVGAGGDGVFLWSGKDILKLPPAMARTSANTAKT